MNRRRRPAKAKGKTYFFADLFCGAGGFAEGFRQAGFRSVFAADIDEAAAKTYKGRFGHEVHTDGIAKVEKLPRVDVIIGGPPCQGFSRLGKMTPTDDHSRLNGLWRHFLRLVAKARPLAFVVENVPEFLRSKDFKSFTRRAEKLGYVLGHGVLDASAFGVPQRRRRAFVIGILGVEPQLPLPSGRPRTVREALRGLPSKPNGRNLHIGRNPTAKSLKRYRCIPLGGNRFDLMRKRPDLTPPCWKKKSEGSTDVFGRLIWKAPAPTIRTEFFKPEKGRYLHPRANRAITPREAARLQSFPDGFKFHGTLTQIGRQIGNAVPPRLAKAVARSLRRLLPHAERTRKKQRRPHKPHR